MFRIALRRKWIDGFLAGIVAVNDGEERGHGTDPRDPDTDDDGKTDGDAVKIFGANPLVAHNAVRPESSGGGTTDLPLPALLPAFAAPSRREAAVVSTD